MDTTQKIKLRQVFDEAIELPAADRTAFVDSRCGSDAQIKDAVEELIKSYEKAGTFLGDRAVSVEPQSSRAVHPSHIGPYRVFRVLGRGGYGTVYLAKRESSGDNGASPAPLVAVKVISGGMVTKESLARFDLEREAVSRMDHTHIARMVEAGTTEDGQPYFAAEYINGLPITDFCRSNNLSQDDRLLLFADLCDAIQHAHRNGIIHRDVKPSNVLVAFEGERVVAKVIDFGIAKAIDSSDPSMTLQFGPSGTPQYMCPEALAEPRGRTDIRSDVYGLGLILYELLTDSPAFDPEAFKRGGQANVRRLILEVDPPLPSQRVLDLSAIDGSGGTTFSSREVLFNRVLPLRGELDWIVVKAIDKDPDRRYPTADALAQDVRHYLNGDEVTARPPSTAYQLRKFIRRNRRLSLAVGAVAASLLLGLIGTSIGFYRASVARNIAQSAQVNEAAQHKIADQQRAQALLNAAEAKAEADKVFGAQVFLNELISPGGAADGSPGAMTPDVLRYVSARAGDGSLADHPEVEGPVRIALGNAWLNYQRYKEAETQFARAVEIHRKLEPNGGLNTASSLNNLAVSRCAQGQYDGAELLLRESLRLYRLENRPDGPHDAPAIAQLGEVLDHTHHSADAIEPLRLALKIYRESAGPHDVKTIYVLRRLADAVEHAGDAKLAQQYRDEAADLERQGARVPAVDKDDGTATAPAQ